MRRFFCEIPDEFLFTNLATLNELALAVKEGSRFYSIQFIIFLFSGCDLYIGSLTPSQKQRFESSAGAASVDAESPTTIPISHTEPWCPWFTCCY